MATGDVFSEKELTQLRGFPEITHAESIRHVTPTGADEGVAHQFRDVANVLGAAVQLCTLPWLGFAPAEVRAGAGGGGGSGAAGERLELPVDELAGYAVREQTRTDDRRAILYYRRQAHHRYGRVEGTRRVSVRPGDGTRYAEAAVRSGVRVPALIAGGAPRCGAARACRYRADQGAGSRRGHG